MLFTYSKISTDPKKIKKMLPHLYITVGWT